uniref:AN1-type domain-containing protein n=1 Tax=Cyanistes caeruleus TaxID=156563 RepID=A0A8C0VTQ8_CYACU
SAGVDLRSWCSRGSQRHFLPLKCDACEQIFCTDHIAYAQHDCTSAYKKIFTNKCLKPGCKQKEMMKVICDQCHKNYCLKHRHPLDHDCSGAGHPLSKAGEAHAWLGSTLPATCASGLPPAPDHGQAGDKVFCFQSEEEALQRALEMSLAEHTMHHCPSSTQEEEDLALAQALSASEAEYQQLQRQVRLAMGSALSWG